jgi:hypothetical protein
MGTAIALAYQHACWFSVGAAGFLSVALANAASANAAASEKRRNSYRASR